jgi:hypothetical protein
MITTKSIVGVLAFFSLTVGTICAVIIIFSDTNVVQNLEYKEAYQAVAGIMNIITVIFLTYLTMYLPNYGVIAKTFIIIVLLVGLVAEIFLDLAGERAPNPQDIAIGHYILLTLNFLIRGYLTLFYIQQDWSVLPSLKLPQPSDLVPEMTAPVVKSVEKIATDEDEIGKYKARWRSILDRAREKGGQTIEQVSYKAGWDVVNNAIKDNQMNSDNLQKALDILKYNDGTEVKGISLTGGRAKRR